MGSKKERVRPESILQLSETGPEHPHIKPGALVGSTEGGEQELQDTTPKEKRRSASEVKYDMFELTIESTQ